MLEAGVSIGSVVIAAVVVVLLVRRIRRDPRWLGNAYLLAIAVAALLVVLSAAGGLGAVIIGVVLSAGLLLSPFAIIGLIMFLIVNGVITVRREGLRPGNALSLLLGTGLAVAVVFFFLGLGQGSVWLAAAAVWVFLMCAWVGFLLLSFLGYGAVYQRLVRHAPVDYVIVLGSGLRADGTVTKLLAQRVDRGLAVQAAQRRSGRSVPVIMSGGQGSDEVRPEAEAMAEYAIGRGADPDLVLVEDRSTNTEENLRNSGELVRSSAGVDADARGMVVSSNYHVLRAASLARELDLPLQATGAPVAFYYWPTASIREWVAVVKPHWPWHLLAAALVTLPLPVLLLLAAA